MRQVLRAAALVLIALGTLAACVAERAASWDDEVHVGPVGEVAEIVENVGYYPACGNETVEVNGVTWYPFKPTADSQLPVDPLAATPGGAAAASGGLAPRMSRSSIAGALPGVVAPGPGDDVGTMVIFDSGVAFWESHSGSLHTWLTDEATEYNWVC